MNNTFDELAKNLAQSVTRRQALRRFGVGIAGAVLASLGLRDRAEAGKHQPTPECKKACNHCRSYPWGCRPDDLGCLLNCQCCYGPF